MSKESTLAKNTIIYAVGNLGSKLISFILLPLYTYYLSTYDYGYFDVITTTLTLLVPIVTFQIYDGLYRYLLDTKDKEQSSRIITNSLFIILRNLSVFIIGYVIFIQFKSFKYEFLILLQLVLNILSAFWTQVARGLKKNVAYSIAGILATIVTLVSNVLFITVMNLRVGSLIMSNILASIVVIIYIEKKLKVRNYFNIKFSNKLVKKSLIVFSIPLIPNLISWWFMNVSDRYFLTYYNGIQSNGVYAISNKFPSLLVMINTIFSLAWQESAISEYNAEDRNKFYTKMFDLLINVEFTSVVVLLAFTKLIMRVLVSGGFSDAWMYVPFLYIGTIFNSFSSFYGTGYLSSKETIGAFYTSVVGGVVNILGNIILIPMIGIQGASISTMVSFLIMWIVRLRQTKKYFKINIRFKKLILLIIISGLFIISYYYNSNKIIENLLMIISLIIFIIFNRELIAKLFGVVTNKIGTN